MKNRHVVIYHRNFVFDGRLVQEYIEPLQLFKTPIFHSKHSQKKQKDSLRGSLGRVLLAAKLEFPKILVPGLSQNTSDVNIECAGNSEWPKHNCIFFM